MSKQRKAMIIELTEFINNYSGAVTPEQVEHWVGSDTTNSQLDDHIEEIYQSKGESGPTSADVLALWDEQ